MENGVALMYLIWLPVQMLLGAAYFVAIIKSVRPSMRRTLMWAYICTAFVPVLYVTTVA